ncbi:MAG: 5'-nucleotidase, lipoprotein e(P4) family [Proteobacteria bacterium]|nr:5'-nucleotidase, lipoprotein e(P4) family [Pseudomonadota bacterium]
MKNLVKAAVIFAAAALLAIPAGAGPNDNLNATLWTQHSVEFKGSALTAYALATLRLDQALADNNWSALAAAEQGDGYLDKPAAVILDVDETVLDNSPYQTWMVLNGKSFDSKTWTKFVNTVTSRPIPGSLAFTKYAASKGVKIFYVSNRDGKLEDATRKNLEKFGYPMGGNVDTVLLKKERPEWESSKKSPRRAHVGKDYRVLLLIGDNFGDFVDGYRNTQAGRAALMEKHADKWGKQWIVVANPTYGSWEAAAYGFNYKLSDDEKRALKLGTFEAWQP